MQNQDVNVNSVFRVVKTRKKRYNLLRNNERSPPMKKIFISAVFIATLLFLVSCLPSKIAKKTNTNAKEDKKNMPTITEAKLNYTDVKAMWISQFDLSEPLCDGKQRDKYQFTRLIEDMLDNVKSIGVNTVIVQVRPNADSLYPSKYYPPSVYAVGAYGNEFSYDPFEIIVEEAHERELSIHAWINPMRAMTETQIENIDERFTLKKWWDNEKLRKKYFPTVGGRVYLNIAYPEVRQLITDGAREIIEKYDVDGLHMDDYFYPTTDTEFDTDAYEEYGKGKSLGDWRRDNLNTLVKGIYDAVKQESQKVLFGISPAGTMEKDYETMYADVYEWCKNEGYIDYICPQIYFGMEHETCSFDNMTDQWNAIVKSDTVKMWVGMTLGKTVAANAGEGDKWAGTGRDEWINNKDVLKRCLDYTKNADKCVGVAFFSYQYFFDSLTGWENEASQEERDNFVPVLKEIGWEE